MAGYRKGADFERELVKKFWSSGWTAVRVAGSGTTPFPVPDVIAVKDKRTVVIECKATKKERLNVKKALFSIIEFSKKADTETYIAIKFPHKEPRFYDIKKLVKRKHFTISIKDRYLSFESLLGEQKQL